ncbi:MAG: hypothetical protein VKK04_24845 [Synechococcales bacterium]|nr:hypothetical protein [Synechococcales bacterium]
MLIQSGEDAPNLALPPSGAVDVSSAAAVPPLASSHAEPYVAAFREAGHLTPRNWPNAALRADATATTSSAGASFSGHAAPLMPIRGRDVKAMSELFDIQNIAEIERDINQNLTRLYPEPCWGDEVFSFLSHFL